MTEREPMKHDSMRKLDRNAEVIKLWMGEQRVTLRELSEKFKVSIPRAHAIITTQFKRQ